MKTKWNVKWTDWAAAVLLVMALGAFAAAETAEDPANASTSNAKPSEVNTTFGSTTAQAH